MSCGEKLTEQRVSSKETQFLLKRLKRKPKLPLAISIIVGSAAVLVGGVILLAYLRSNEPPPSTEQETLSSLVEQTPAPQILEEDEAEKEPQETPTSEPEQTEKPTPEAEDETVFVNEPPSADISDSIGVWEGELIDLTEDGESARQIILNITYADGYIISGIIEIVTVEDVKEQYLYTGTINRSTLEASIQNEQWINYHGDRSFATLDGTLDLSANVITGFIDSDSSRPFSLTKTSSTIDDAHKHHLSAAFAPFDGEFDNTGWTAMMSMPGHQIHSINNFLPFNQAIDGQILSGDNTIYTEGFLVGFIRYSTSNRNNMRWQNDNPGNITYSVDISNYDMFRVMLGIGWTDGQETDPARGTGGRREAHGELLIFVDDSLVIERSFAGRDDDIPVLLYFPEAKTLRIEASGLALAFFEPYFRNIDGSIDVDTSINYPEMTDITINFPHGSEQKSVSVSWGAELFSQPSNVFNNDLALLSAALSAATYLIDEDFNDINYYINNDDSGIGGHYIEEAFLTLGFPDESIRLYSYPGHPKNQDGRNGNPRVPGASDDALAYAIASRFITVNERGSKPDCDSTTRNTGG